MHQRPYTKDNIVRFAFSGNDVFCIFLRGLQRLEVVLQCFSIFCQIYLTSYRVNQRLNDHGSTLMIQISQDVF